ncbi:GNAT family N-acetyltransferase [Flagellimonas crocea]|uniref:GNAT family N-acetyltransferase n=1 Tax=Flagellimonas crocea TaxID=3067311 RepID=UPI00296FFE33|nr:GNAT family N-acetyltransferase [Muricauda sp. DH64]
MGTVIDFDQNGRRFLKWEKPPDQFLAAMPEEWQWDFYIYLENTVDHMELFAITEQDHILGGGMVFKGLPPEMKIFEKEVETFVERGYLYIGFLFVVPKYRGQHIGSTWLESMKALYSDKGFWLTVEEPSLIEFYEKNGFKWTGTLVQGKRSEELLTLEPSNHFGG